MTVVFVRGWRPNWWVVGGAVLVGGAAIACTVASAGVGALQEQLALMDELLDRDRLRERVECGELSRVDDSFVRAWLLAAAGDAEGLDELLNGEFSAGRRGSDGVRDMLAYVEERRSTTIDVCPASTRTVWSKETRSGPLDTWADFERY